MIGVGDTAPDFTLPSQSGEDVTLSAVLARADAVLYFYPKDETPGCTAEACSFRDSFEVFKDAGAEVLGVSADSVDAHARFATRNRLPFILLSDRGNRVRRLYGVRGAIFGLLPGRVTFVIGRDGVVRHVFNSQLNVTRHIDEALAALSS